MLRSNGYVFIRAFKETDISREPISQPHLVVHQQREYLLVLHRVLITNDDELLLMLHKGGHIFAEQGERRIGHHDVGLVHEVEAFPAAEVPITLKLGKLVLAILEQLGHVQHIDAAVTHGIVNARNHGLVRLVPVLLFPAQYVEEG